MVRIVECHAMDIRDRHKFIRRLVRNWSALQLSPKQKHDFVTDWAVFFS